MKNMIVTKYGSPFQNVVIGLKILNMFLPCFIYMICMGNFYQNGYDNKRKITDSKKFKIE